MTSHPENWRNYIPGDRVRILRKGHSQAVGRVDDLMPDGSVVWVVQENGMGRTMVLPDEGVSLRRVSKDDRTYSYRGPSPR
jgi:hypothetical protein